jgi:hypothetical protein
MTYNMMKVKINQVANQSARAFGNSVFEKAEEIPDPGMRIAAKENQKPP